MYTDGIDISTHQDNATTPQRIDFSKPLQHGIKFIINRATYVASKDDDFDYNWNQEKNYRYVRGAYGFWGYWDGCPSATIQAQALVSILRPDPGEFPVVWLDVEKASSYYPNLPPQSVSLPSIERYMKTVEDGLGKPMGIYTNIAGLISLSPIPNWLMEKPLWIAWPISPSTGETARAFIERTGIVPPIGRYWSNPWLIWQYFWKGPGLAMGMESYGLDMNAFNGDEEEFYKFCNTGEIIDPDDNIEEGEKMLKMKVIAGALNVRSGPGTGFSIIKRLYQNDIVTVYNVDGVDGSWVQINENENLWTCVRNLNGRYLEKI